MIEGRTILCFASGYDAPPTSKHHVMHLLAERNTVLWVNYHASRAPTASASDLRYMARKVCQIFRGITNPRENLYVLTSPVLPLPGSALAKRINRRLLIARIRSALGRVGRGPVQVWSFTPDISYLLGHFGEEKVVYYFVDDHASFLGYDAEQVRRDEEDLCRRADLVVTTSQALQDAKAPLNPNTILVTHGVDYEHFSRALRDDLPLPDDIKDIPRPILGFFGLIRDWVDLDLLAEVCRLRLPRRRHAPCGPCVLMVENHQAGAICDETAASLATAIENVRRNMTSMRPAAKRLAQEHFDLATTLEQYDRLYQSLQAVNRAA